MDAELVSEIDRDCRLLSCTIKISLSKEAVWPSGLDAGVRPVNRRCFKPITVKPSEAFLSRLH